MRSLSQDVQGAVKDPAEAGGDLGLLAVLEGHSLCQLPEPGRHLAELQGGQKSK